MSERLCSICHKEPREYPGTPWCRSCRMKMKPTVMVHRIRCTEKIHPKNLIWGYTINPTRMHIWDWKSDYFGRGKKERIRCRDCGKRMLTQVLNACGRCSECQDAYDAAHPYVPEPRSGPANVYPDGYPEGRRVAG